MMKIRELIGDEHIEAPICDRHHRTRAEVEEVRFGDPAQLFTDESNAMRIRVIGPRLDGRLLVIILGPEGEDRFYVVTARPPKRQELRLYSTWKARQSQE